MNLSGLNKKFITYIIIAIAVVIFIFILIFVLSSLKPKKLSYTQIENTLKESAQKYYGDHKDMLPAIDGGIVEVDATTLVSEKYMKNLSSLVKDNVECTGKVVVYKNGEYYSYVPRLSCGEKYSSSSLSSKIRDDNPIVVNGDGLYEFGSYLIFRGERVSNYVQFNDSLWRILRINEDGSLRIIQNNIEFSGVFDDRYNINRGDSTGINEFNISRLKDGLEKIYYETDFFKDSAKNKIKFTNLCIGKRDEEAIDNSGLIECSTLSEPEPVGLINTNEFMLASIDPNCLHTYDLQCSNYNYLSEYTKASWTLNADLNTTHKAYKFNSDGYFLSTTSNETGLRLVVTINDINYTKGTGTEEDPYIIK